VDPVRRWALFALGWIFFALGLAGTVLPVLPTTPFMLLALWAFSSSSERFHGWLYHHRVFGPPLRRWTRERSVSPWVKVVALGSLSASYAWMVFWVRPPWWAIAAMTPVFLFGAIYVGRLSTRSGTDLPPEPPPPTRPRSHVR
jgi:uncharacterized membrane protein YbaN (DUF454 family)